MMLADAHLHLFRNGFPGLYGESLLRPEIEVYENLRKAHGIAAGLVVGYEGEGIDPSNNAYIRALTAERPWMHTVAYADAHSAPTADVVTAILESGHAGVALYVTDAAKGAAAAAWPASAWNVLHQARALVSLNATPECLALIAPAIENFSGCTFLISHMGLPGSYRQPLAMADAEARLAPLLRLAALPNVMVKISAPYAISDPAFSYPHVAAEPFLDLILNRFGVERCLWGSDFSPSLDHVSFAQTISYPWLERLGDVDRASVMGGNLLRLLDSAKK
jgi:L-fuconolactonase